MWDQLWSGAGWALGLEVAPKDLAAWQMALRAAVAFIAAIAIARIADKRFMGKYAPLDIMLAVVFGSIVSRAITGNTAFFPALGACLVLVLLHRLIGAIAFHSDRFGRLVKGQRRLLISDGEIQWDEMKKSHISRRDLEEALRQHTRSPRLDEVKAAYLERNGSISIVLRDP